MNHWPLIGVGVVMLGFMLRMNPVLVVVTAGLASGLAAGMSIPDLLALLGTSFVSNRTLFLFVLTLPVIGLLEHYGLREQARRLIERIRNLNLAGLLISYLSIRQVLGMFGLLDVAGHAQTVRPLVAPMSEAAAAKMRGVPLTQDESHQVRAMAAATDNVGRFFGEDVFVAFAAVVLIQKFFQDNGIVLEPTDIALWALPTAVAAFLIHAVRIVRMQSRLKAAVHEQQVKEQHDAAP
jgi:uncharacterized membrane protein